MLPLHDLAVVTLDGVPIAELALANQRAATELAMTFRPGALAILSAEHRYVNVITKEYSRGAEFTSM
jgi:hypothetical protein